MVESHRPSGFLNHQETVARCVVFGGRRSPTPDVPVGGAFAWDSKAPDFPCSGSLVSSGMEGEVMHVAEDLRAASLYLADARVKRASQLGPHRPWLGRPLE